MTHYEVLDVAPSATPAEVRRAYLSLARKHHPDRVGGSGPEAQRMREVNAAWAVLGDTARRADYDRSLAGGRPGGDGRAPTPGPGRQSFVRAPREDVGSSNATSPDWQPIDDHADDHDEDPAALLDDTPVPGTEVPRVLQVVPAYLLGLAVISLVVGAIASLDPVVALGVVALVLAMVGFVVAPVYAIFASRHHDLDP